MKRLITLLTIILTVALTMPTVQAKKFGGSRSFGKSQPTTTAKPASTQTTNQSKAANNTSNKKGLMGGLLGGLLAGGLIAAMLGGAFEGFQMMDMVIIALLAFILFKVFRAMSRAKTHSQQQPRYATPDGNMGSNQNQSQPPQWSQPSAASTQSQQGEDNVPMNFPAGFDLNEFVEGARQHYHILQQAWNENDLTKIKEYVAPELYHELIKERQTLPASLDTQVLFLDTQAARGDHDHQKAEISIKFTGRCKDNQADTEEEIAEVWHLERQINNENAPWLIVGIEQ